MDKKEFRAALSKVGMTQLDAARIFDVNPRTVRRWALGDGSPPMAVSIALRLMLVMQNYGISVDLGQGKKRTKKQEREATHAAA
jgi:DNA-binding transcriptional regulator YiaG